jgi:hypothetical protein
MEILKMQETRATYLRDTGEDPSELPPGYAWSQVILYSPTVPDGQVVAWVVNAEIARVIKELWNHAAETERAKENR